jgi:hypothetical protein
MKDRSRSMRNRCPSSDEPRSFNEEPRSSEQREQSSAWRTVFPGRRALLPLLLQGGGLSSRRRAHCYGVSFGPRLFGAPDGEDHHEASVAVDLVEDVGLRPRRRPSLERETGTRKAPQISFTCRHCHVRRARPARAHRNAGRGRYAHATRPALLLTLARTLSPSDLDPGGLAARDAGRGDVWHRPSPGVASSRPLRRLWPRRWWRPRTCVPLIFFAAHPLRVFSDLCT